MAQRRMFNKTIIGSAKFLKMPIDSQNLYFHLGMYADDDGVVEAFPIMRLIGSSEDNLKVLASKGFIVILNDDLVSFISDWNEHNLIRADRKIDSKYKNLLVEIVKDVKLVEPRSKTKEKVTAPSNDGQMSAQDRIGKDRTGKVSIVEDSIGNNSIVNAVDSVAQVQPTPAEEAQNFFNNPEVRDTVIRRLKEKGMDEEFIRSEINKFVLYWTEPTRNGKKQLWETKKTFEIRRRLVKWFSNTNQKQQTNYSKPKGKNYDE